MSPRKPVRHLLMIYISVSISRQWVIEHVREGLQQEQYALRRSDLIPQAKAEGSMEKGLGEIVKRGPRSKQPLDSFGFLPLEVRETMYGEVSRKGSTALLRCSREIYGEARVSINLLLSIFLLCTVGGNERWFGEIDDFVLQFGPWLVVMEGLQAV